MAPCMGSRLQVAFYATPAEQLAQQHPVVGALLRCCRPRSGCYLCPTEDLANAAQLSPSEVHLQPACQARHGDLLGCAGCHGGHFGAKDT